MAVYYGQVEGSGASTATRTGTKASGIKASVQSYDGSVIVRLKDNIVTVWVGDESTFYGDRIFEGTLEEFKNKLKEGSDEE